MRAAYAQAHRRLLLLDYDGTLVGIAQTPAQAIPTAKTLEVLRVLTDDPRNVVVVISGREQDTLDNWLGKLPVGLTAEHGAFSRYAGGVWQATGVHDIRWKAAVRTLFEEAIIALPGSFIEEKRTTLAWHYRLSDQRKARSQVARISDTLRALQLSRTTVMAGKKVLEVRTQSEDKGTAAKRWLASETFDFVLAAGDEPTDEAMFAALDPEAVTIKVGGGDTLAHYRVTSQPALLAFLHSLA